MVLETHAALKSMVNSKPSALTSLTDSLGMSYAVKSSSIVRCLFSFSSCKVICNGMLRRLTQRPNSYHHQQFLSPFQQRCDCVLGSSLSKALQLYFTGIMVLRHRCVTISKQSCIQVFSVEVGASAQGASCGPHHRIFRELPYGLLPIAGRVEAAGTKRAFVANSLLSARRACMSYLRGEGGSNNLQLTIFEPMLTSGASLSAQPTKTLPAKLYLGLLKQLVLAVKNARMGIV